MTSLTFFRVSGNPKKPKSIIGRVRDRIKGPAVTRFNSSLDASPALYSIEVRDVRIVGDERAPQETIGYDASTARIRRSLSAARRCRARSRSIDTALHRDLEQRGCGRTALHRRSVKAERFSQLDSAANACPAIVVQRTAEGLTQAASRLAAWRSAAGVPGPLAPRDFSSGGACGGRSARPAINQPGRKLVAQATRFNFTQDGAVRLARLAHNQKVVGSNPTPATKFSSGERTDEALAREHQSRLRKHSASMQAGVGSERSSLTRNSRGSAEGRACYRGGAQKPMAQAYSPGTPQRAGLCEAGIKSGTRESSFRVTGNTKTKTTNSSHYFLRPLTRKKAR